jgi:hypothetical protein
LDNGTTNHSGDTVHAFHNEVLRKAGQLIADLRARHAGEDIDEAAGLVVIVIEPDGRQMRCHGPFPDPVAALAWAESYTGVLNEAMPSRTPFTAGVHLLFDPRL